MHIHSLFIAFDPTGHAEHDKSLVSDLNMKFPLQIHVCEFESGCDPLGHGLQTPLTKAVPVTQAHLLFFHYELIPHRLTHVDPTLKNPSLH